MPTHDIVWMPAKEIKTVISSPFDGKLMISNKVWNDPAQGFRARPDDWKYAGSPDYYPRQWEQTLAVMPDILQFRSGEWAETNQGKAARLLFELQRLRK